MTYQVNASPIGLGYAQVETHQVETHIQLGQKYRQTACWARACYHYQQALKLRPHDSALHCELGAIFHRLGEWDLAARHYHWAIQQHPGDADALFRLGILSSTQGQFGLAIACYEQTIAIQPNAVEAYINLAALLAQKRSPTEAMTFYQQALQRFPENLSLHNNLGKLYEESGNLAAATTQYTKALALDPSFVKAQENLGLLWFKHHNDAIALEHFAQASTYSPQPAQALSDCTAAAFRCGDFAKAFTALERSIVLDQPLLAAYCQRHLAAPRCNLLDETHYAAARFIEAFMLTKENQTRERSPHFPQVQDWLFELYLHSAELAAEAKVFGKAEQCYQMALLLQPEATPLYSALAGCLEQQQRWAAAKAIRQLAPPDGSPARDNLTPQNPDPAPTPLPQRCLAVTAWLAEQSAAIAAGAVTYQAIASPASTGIAPQALPGCEPLSPGTAAQPYPAWKPAHPLAKPDHSAQTSAHQTADSAAAACGGVTCQRCMGQLIDSFAPRPLAAGLFQCNLERAPTLRSPARFAVTLPQGQAWIAPKLSPWKVCDEIAVMTQDHVLLEELSRCYPWRLPPCVKRNGDRLPPRDKSPSEPSLFKRKALPPVRAIEGRVALLSTLSGHIYYHWMIDLLPRIGLLRAAGFELDQIDWFVVNSLDSSFQRETLIQLGIPLEKVIESDKYPHLLGQELIVPSFPGDLDWVPSHTTQFLRQHFLPEQQPPAPSGIKHLYVSRSRSSYRHVLNEAAVLDCLTPLGFATVYLEELTVREQAQLFAHAEVIISAHGSGLTNLVFCQPGSKIIELFSPNYVRTDYWMVSQDLRLEHYYILGRQVSNQPLRQLMYQSPLMEDIYVELSSIRSALRLMGITEEP